MIVFDPTIVGVEAILEFRKQLYQQASDYFEVPLDICVLTVEEAVNNQFIEEEGAIQVIG